VVLSFFLGFSILIFFLDFSVESKRHQAFQNGRYMCTNGRVFENFLEFSKDKTGITKGVTCRAGVVVVRLLSAGFE